MPRTPRRLQASLRAVRGLWAHESWSLWRRISGGVSGTTWKKKSRHGFPVVRNVGDMFSVRVMGGGGWFEMVLNFETIRSMKGSEGVLVLVLVLVLSVWAGSVGVGLGL